MNKIEQGRSDNIYWHAGVSTIILLGTDLPIITQPANYIVIIYSVYDGLFATICLHFLFHIKPNGKFTRRERYNAVATSTFNSKVAIDKSRTEFPVECGTFCWAASSELGEIDTIALDDRYRSSPCRERTQNLVVVGYDLLSL